MRLLLSLALLSTCGCASLLGAGGGGHRVGAPGADRCAGQAAGARQACAQARFAALEQVRKLYVDDQLCLDGQHPLEMTSAPCTVRAFVEGVTGHELQLEIRAAPEGSRYQVMDNWVFDEAALADVQLRALGYALPGESTE
jgi:hypothetical protein